MFSFCCSPVREKEVRNGQRCEEREKPSLLSYTGLCDVSFLFIFSLSLSLSLYLSPTVCLSLCLSLFPSLSLSFPPSSFTSVSSSLLPPVSLSLCTPVLSLWEAAAAAEYAFIL